MASNTRKVENVRANKRTKAGLKRKNKLKLHGSTRPLLALDKPNAHELAQKKPKSA